MPRLQGNWICSDAGVRLLRPSRGLPALSRQASRTLGKSSQMEPLSFDRAIELLGISDVRSLTEEDLVRIGKVARKRWHPDNVSHRGNAADVERYTTNFQLVDYAVAEVRNFLEGSLHAGPATVGASGARSDAAEDVIRREATSIQAHLRAIWEAVKASQFMHSQNSVRISDGFRLGDLLNEDFKDDIAALSVVSCVYGGLVFGIGAAVAGAISPLLGIPAGLFALAQVLSCVLGALPLSRFWLPSSVQEWMVWFVNLGVRIYRFFERETAPSENLLVQFLVQGPALLAVIVKYVVLWPSYEIAKLSIGDKIVGVVDQSVDYYGGFADWYVDQLLGKQPVSMTRDELLDLGQLYSVLGGFAPSAAAV